MNTGIFDSHAHYDDAKFEEDREPLLSRIHEGGVEYIMTIGSDLASSERSVALAEEHPFLFAAVGVHPEQAGEAPADYLDSLRRMAQSGRVRAIGEIGLDYYWPENPPHELQQRFFEEQILLARELELPIIVHDRDAHADTISILKKYRPRGVVHCFSGSAEMAREILRLGMYIGFTGAITFKNARRAPEAAAVVPDDRLLLETDCPYMAPEPHRGKRNDSSLLPFVAQRLGEIRGQSAEEIIRQTNQNARTLFGI